MFNLDFNEIYKISIETPEKFWNELAQDVEWNKPYTRIIDNSHWPSPQWFCDGELNMAYNCLDKQVNEGYGNEVALIFDSPVTGVIQKFTYKKLLDLVELTAGILVQKCHITKNDTVLLYMPKVPECLIFILACLRIGATYSTVFAGFSVMELSRRIKHIQPKMVMTTNVGFEGMTPINYKERVDVAINQSETKIEFCLVFNRSNYPPSSMIPDRDLDWNKELSNVTPEAFVPLKSNHPSFIIYTSGTTGDPKGMIMPTAGSVIWNKYILKYNYTLNPGESVLTFSDFGWILGLTTGSFGPLMTRNPIVLYEGSVVGTPDNKQFGRLLKCHKVAGIFGPPTIMRILKRECSMDNLNLSDNNLKYVGIGGERIEPELKEWIKETLNCNVYELYGQTEIGGIVFGPYIGFKNSPNKHIEEGSVGLVPGVQIMIMDLCSGRILGYNEMGRIFLKMPVTPFMASTYLKNNEGFVKMYFSQYPGYFDTKDIGVQLNENVYQIICRDDDVMQVSALRVCATVVEEACLRNPDISEVAVVPLDDNIQGQLPFAFLVPRNSDDLTKRQIIDDTIEQVKQSIGELICFTNAVLVPCIAKTKTGKISRNVLTSMLNGRVYKIPSSIEDREVFVKLFDELKRNSYGATLPTNL